MNPDGTEFPDKIKSGLTPGRYGKSSGIAAAVAFLAGEEASFVTGSTLTVDGGQNA